MKLMDVPVEEMGLSEKMVNCLYRKGLTSLGKLAGCDWETLKGTAGIGSGSVRRILSRCLRFCVKPRWVHAAVQDLTLRPYLEECTSRELERFKHKDPRWVLMASYHSKFMAEAVLAGAQLGDAIEHRWFRRLNMIFLVRARKGWIEPE